MTATGRESYAGSPYVELPLPVRVGEPERIGRRHRRHWLLIVGLLFLAIFLIGVTVTGGTQ